MLFSLYLSLKVVHSSLLMSMMMSMMVSMMVFSVMMIIIQMELTLMGLEKSLNLYQTVNQTLLK